MDLHVRENELPYKIIIYLKFSVKWIHNSELIIQIGSRFYESWSL